MTIVKQRLGARIIKFIKKNSKALCFLSYLTGVAHLLILAYRGYNDGTYFSENALLPGLVQGEYYDEKSIHSFHAALTPQAEAAGRSIPAEWLVDAMRKIGLEAYVHEYNVSYPFGIADGEAVPGKNVYGIMRALRTPSTESVVLSAPYRPPDNGLKPENNYAIATMLAFAQFARKTTYWAKDIIVLVTDHEDVGMAAWLEAYHQMPSTHFKTAELQARGGSIQAAINLEMNSKKLAAIDLKIEGLNGQLPNLDLVNLAVRMIRKEGIVPKLKNRVDHQSPNSRNGLLHSLKTLARGMLGQATGYHSGNHGLFHKYHVEAITLSSLEGAPSDARFGALEMARIVESIFRSLNNLLERFHQSFFFYVLPATERYVSIGLYMRPFALIVVPLIVQAFSLWSDAGMMELIPPLKEMIRNLCSNPNKEREDEEDESEEPKPPVNVLHIVINLAYSYLAAFVIFVSHRFFMDTGRVFRVPLSTGLLLGHVALLTPILIIPVYLSKIVESSSSQRAPPTSVACIVQGHSHDAPFSRGMTTSTSALLKCVSLMLLALFLFSLSLTNFSLALLTSLIVVPVALVTSPRETLLARGVTSLLVLAVSPPMLFLYGVVMRMLMYDEDVEMARVFSVYKEGLFSSVVDLHVHGVQTITIAVLGYFPLWLLMWSTVMSRPKDFHLDINLDHQKKED